jgi:hypothetical protein
MKMSDALKLLLALMVLQLDSVLGFKSSNVGCIPREIPSLSPLRVASTTWATSNDGLGASTVTLMIKV